MQIKIELPDELRVRIENYLINLAEAMKRTPENRLVITTEISALEASAREVESEIADLRPLATTNDKAAGKLNSKETRLREITTRREELRGQLEDLQPVTLQGAQNLITALFQHYATALPEAIADELAPICPTRHKAIGLAKLSEAWRAALGLRNWAGNTAVNPPVATAANIAWLTAILDRALKGQPHLGVDAPETEPAP